MKRFYIVLVLISLLYGCDLAQPQPTVVVIPTLDLRPTPTLLALTTARPTPSINQPTITPLVIPTVGTNTIISASDRLLVSANNVVRTQFGPLSPSQQWLITQSITAEQFELHAPGLSFIALSRSYQGQALGWSSDGALLLWRSQQQPDLLQAIEPFSGQSATVLTSTNGLIQAALMTNNALYYAAGDDDLRIMQVGGNTQEQVIIRLPKRQLLAGGLQLSPNRDQLALLLQVRDQTAMELQLFDLPSNQIRLLDQSQRGTNTPRLVWNARGALAYYLGDDFRIYEPSLNTIQTTNLGVEPLAWLDDGIIVRTLDRNALVYWSPTQVYPINDPAGEPRYANDLQALDQTQFLLLNQGAIWQIQLE